MTNKPISQNPQVLNSTPIFTGTRVPINLLFEHLIAGDTINEFLQSFPSVSHEQAVGVIGYVKALIQKQ